MFSSSGNVGKTDRRVTHRGSDVRLDSSRLMRPDVWPRQLTDPSRWTWKLLHSWKWEHGGHITELEMRSAPTASRWRARSASLLRTRFVQFIDNQSSLAVLVKFRSSSRKLNAVARKTAAILLCTLSKPLYAYTDTNRNPADAGSRRRHATTKSSDCTKSSSRRWWCRAQHTHATSPAVSSPKRISTTIACTVADALSSQGCTALSTWLRDKGQYPSPDKDGLDAQLCEDLE